MLGTYFENLISYTNNNTRQISSAETRIHSNTLDWSRDKPSVSAVVSVLRAHRYQL